MWWTAASVVARTPLTRPSATLSRRERDLDSRAANHREILLPPGEGARSADEGRETHGFNLDGTLECRAMLSREYLRERADEYRQALKNRGASVDLERFLALDAERRQTITRVEALKAQRNAASQEIAALKKNKQDASSQIDAMKRVGDEIKELDARLADIESELQNLELYFPNVPHESVPLGSDESDNRLEKTWGDKPSFDFTPKPHWE